MKKYTAAHVYHILTHLPKHLWIYTDFRKAKLSSKMIGSNTCHRVTWLGISVDYSIEHEDFKNLASISDYLTKAEINNELVADEDKKWTIYIPAEDIL